MLSNLMHGTQELQPGKTRFRDTDEHVVKEENAVMVDIELQCENPGCNRGAKEAAWKREMCCRATWRP